MFDSGCQVTIQLDDPSPARPGDLVRGAVKVEVAEACECKGIVVGLGWLVHGIGSPHREVIETRALCGATRLTPGLREFKFEFEAPNGPFSYRGHYFNVSQELTARVKVPWAKDAKGRRQFLLHPGPSKKPLAYDVGHKKIARNDPNKNLTLADQQMAALGGVVFFLGLCLTLSVTLWGLIAVAVGLVIPIGTAGRMLAMMRLRGLKVTLAPQPMSPDGALHLRVAFSPSSDVQINAIRATLIATEYSTEDNGSAASTFKHRVFKEDHELLGRRALSRGEELSLHEPMRIPGDAPLSVILPDNRVTWQVKLHIDVEKWPDWKRSYPFVMGPVAMALLLCLTCGCAETDEGADTTEVADAQSTATEPALTVTPDLIVFGPVPAEMEARLEVTLRNSDDVALVLRNMRLEDAANPDVWTPRGTVDNIGASQDELSPVDAATLTLGYETTVTGPALNALVVSFSATEGDKIFFVEVPISANDIAP